MMKEKKNIFIMLSVIILLVIIILYFIKQSPKNVIQNKLGIKLPYTSRVINYTYYKVGEHFKAKIFVDKQEINALKKQFSSSMGGISSEKYPESFNFKNTCTWWDLDKNYIEVSYTKDVDGEKKLFGYSLKTRIIWIFISKDKEGQYYIYISY